MSYLLDTNVISELVRPQPASQVLAWFREVPDRALYLSVLSLGEIRKGIERMPTGGRRELVRLWLEQSLPDWFEDRLLPVTALVAERWGRLLAESPRSLPAVDSLLAATAMTHDLRLVTRNVADFDVAGLEVINPWNVA
ncbi:MAG: type II toxin-antitoxin system VapC family toxin [Pseudomonadota bacterium]